MMSSVALPEHPMSVPVVSHSFDGPAVVMRAAFTTICRVATMFDTHPQPCSVAGSVRYSSLFGEIKALSHACHGQVMRAFAVPNVTDHTRLRVEGLLRTLAGLFELFCFVYIGLTLFLADEAFQIWSYTVGGEVEELGQWGGNLYDMWQTHATTDAY
jgi:hypothetical protein